MEDELITREEAAEMIGVSVKVLRQWAYTNRWNLPYIKKGKDVFYRVKKKKKCIKARTKYHFHLY